MQVRDHLERTCGERAPFVTPLLVFTRANVEATGRCRHVYVMHISRLGRFVSYERQRLSPRQRAALAAALKRNTSTRTDMA